MLRTNFDKPELGLRMEITGLQLREAGIAVIATAIARATSSSFWVASRLGRLTCRMITMMRLKTHKSRCRRQAVWTLSVLVLERSLLTVGS